ncbi:MAG: response regulator [Marinagarivorans sp.]|nr:response regulator [Marinagarivorans sp.]
MVAKGGLGESSTLFVHIVHIAVHIELRALDMKKVLVVEDSQMVMRVIKHVIKQFGYFIPLYAETLTEAVAIMAQEPNIFAAMVDLSLPDAPNGEIVDVTLAAKIPTIVLTGSFDPVRREALLAKGIVDYVMKEGRFSYLYACNLIFRLIKNETIHVLVVDDSKTSRRVVTSTYALTSLSGAGSTRWGRGH